MKNVLVTGATSGIGRAMLEHFASEGDCVIAVGRNKEKLEEYETKYPGKIVSMPKDLSNLDSVREIFNECRDKKIMIDVIIHCAGETYNCPLRSSDAFRVDQMVKVNFESFVELCRGAMSKRYVNEGAAIVVMSSTAAISGDRGISAYSATKGAINTFVKSAAKELVARKIRINAIAPSIVDTPMYEETIRVIPEMEETIKNQQSLGIIPPENIAELASFLVSESGRFITGTTIYVGAGLVQ